jgi:hypothetical protein
MFRINTYEKKVGGGRAPPRASASMTGDRDYVAFHKS